MATRLLDRRPLRDDAATDLAERIVSGELAPGARLKDTVIAAELGVSRTSVREALVQLVQRGLLHADAGRGFTVAPFRRHEVANGYPIIRTLEGLALDLSRLPDARAHKKLERLNDLLAVDQIDARQRLAFDDAWHDALLANCPNAHLLRLVQLEKECVRRYEFAYAMQRPPRLSHAEHVTIMLAIASGDRAAARAALEANWRGTMLALLEQIVV